MKEGRTVGKEFRLELPLDEAKVRELKMGDVVYLSGKVFTMRDMGHRRAVDLLQAGQALPFDLREGVLWHCAPIVRRDGNRWEVTSAGATTSSRFTLLGSELIHRLRLRLTIGKGTMGGSAQKAMQEVGSAYLNMTGGCAALYAQQVREVVDVYWTDLGLPEAVWSLRVEDLGPLVVGIDAHGQSLYGEMRGELESRRPGIYASCRLRDGGNLTYLPKRVPGKSAGLF